MTPSDIAAWIGAAAWLPQVAGWFAKHLVKPTLKIIAAPTVTVGYSNVGPIVFLNASISAERKDALIEKISLEAVHERGDSRALTWTWLIETPFQLAVPTGETMNLAKSQPAVALKVSTLSLTEKAIGFQDTEWLSKHGQIYAKLIEQLNYIKEEAGNQPSNLPESLARSKEFREELQFFQDNMYWREGRYEFRVSLKEISLRSPYVRRFSVKLSRTEMENLRKNTGLFEQYVRALAAGGAATNPLWNVANPEIKAVD